VSSILEQIQKKSETQKPSGSGSVLDQIMRATGLTLEDLAVQASKELEGAVETSSPKLTAVPDSPEFQRILHLPRRTEISEDLVASMTEAFSTGLRSKCHDHPQCPGHMTLRPIQALALHDIYQLEGGFLPIRVGGGKTLISYLAPALLSSKRPLLLVPAKLRNKTRAEFAHLARHFHGPKFYRIESYELLGRPQAQDMLDQYRPDFVFMDEAHKVKNTRAAVTRRVKRYFKEHPGTTVVAASGTITSLRRLRAAAPLKLGPPGLTPLEVG
jgi:hypothetical protein